MNNPPIYAQCPEKELSIAKKLKISFFAALIFFFVSSPIMYQFMHNLYGNYFNVADASGCPSNSGLLLHTLIYFTIIFVTMAIT